MNGDDFGAAPGINRGIVAAHVHGILTSASLMVDMPGSREAAELTSSLPKLSVGLHVALTDETGTPAVAFADRDSVRAELGRQLERFEELIGRPPTHVDAHHNVHRHVDLLPWFIEFADEHVLPLRGHSPARYFPRFYGQWEDGTTDLDWIGVANLVRMFAEEIAVGITELSCHPGYVANGFSSTYTVEREVELKTLCDPAVRSALVALDIGLASFADLPRLKATT